MTSTQASKLQLPYGFIFGHYVEHILLVLTVCNIAFHVYYRIPKMKAILRKVTTRGGSH